MHAVLLSLATLFCGEWFWWGHQYLALIILVWLDVEVAGCARLLRWLLNGTRHWVVSLEGVRVALVFQLCHFPSRWLKWITRKHQMCLFNVIWYIWWRSTLSCRRWKTTSSRSRWPCVYLLTHYLVTFCRLVALLVRKERVSVVVYLLRRSYHLIHVAPRVGNYSPNDFTWGGY